MIEEDGGEISSIRDVSSIIPAPTGISAAYSKNRDERANALCSYLCRLKFIELSEALP